MTHKIYDKLVRDNIPAILEANNLKYKAEYLSDAAAMKYILRKLAEECAELVEQVVIKNNEGIIAELADIVSVIMKIAFAHEIDFETVLEREDAKSEANGFFFENIILKYVDEPDSNHQPAPAKKPKKTTKKKKDEEDKDNSV